MQPLLFNLGVSETLFEHTCAALDAEAGRCTVREFPDGESYVRIDSHCDNRCAIVLCSLDHANGKTLPLLYAADTLRELGVTEVGLAAPYLGYMRQDKRFNEGEAVTARLYAKLLSAHFDWIVTVDPHLHRFHAMGEIYSVPALVVHAAPLLADWIGHNVDAPLLIGPDSESEQWVADVAKRIDAPHLVLDKVRSGDRKVQVSIPNLLGHSQRTPVLVDDIISTGHTMAAAIQHLSAKNMRPVVCAAIHGVFAAGAFDTLTVAGAARIVTSNTIAHTTNAMDVAGELAAACISLMQQS